MITGGIDPGLKGGIAIIDDEGTCETHHMPLDDKFIDVKRVVELLQPTECVVMEYVWARPGQGVPNFKLGSAFGQVMGALTIKWRRPVLVSPQRWKTDLNLIGEKKAASNVLARRLFPHAANQFKRVTVDGGRAEAALIAAWHMGLHRVI